MKKYLYPSDILLPDFDRISGTKWAVIACDQYTSEPEYWQSAEDFIGEAPSTLKMMLPEVRLHEADTIVPQIRKTMQEYLESGVLVSRPNCGIYLERTLADGSVRKGLIACIDLEDYDYREDSHSPIRATEKTVQDRIPPRLAIRRSAILEMPHVLLLINDPENTVLGRFSGRKMDAYSFPLMKNSGFVEASFVGVNEFEAINTALHALDGFSSSFVLAVGDGNHSLAAAKAAYEEIKEKLGEKAALCHPARYAMVEVNNIYDDSLQFEPIYRLVKTENPEKLIRDFAAYLETRNGKFGKQSFTIMTKNRETVLSAVHAAYALPVTCLQRFLDDWAKENYCKMDYIHGEHSLRELASQNGYVGFLFVGMKKSELFSSVTADGSLPRKTFSMGHAEDKRFYIECRKIIAE